MGHGGWWGGGGGWVEEEVEVAMREGVDLSLVEGGLERKVI